MIKLTDILLEVGEGTADPYPLKLLSRDVERFKAIHFGKDLAKKIGSEDVRYRFVTDSKLVYLLDMFKTTLTKASSNKGIVITGVTPTGVTMEVSFGVRKGREGIDYDEITNRGELYRVMATVVKAVKEEINRHNKSKEQAAPINKLVLYPSKADESDTRREALYTAYIKRAMPDAQVTSAKEGSRIEVTKPNGF